MKDENVFEAVDKYGADLYRFCMHLCKDKDAADELYQDTFLKLISQNLTLDEARNIKSFLFSIAVWIFKNNQKKAARRNKISPVYLTDDLEYISSGSDIQSDTIEKIRKQTLLQLIDKLNDKYRYPIILFYAMDMSIFQIASILKCSPNTVKSRLFRAKAQLKKEMEAKGFE